jgi:hypothetical protein
MDTIGKPLTYVGQGNRDSIIIECHGTTLYTTLNNFIYVSQRGTRFSNLTIRARGFKALFVMKGGEVSAEDCVFTATKMKGDSYPACILVANGGAVALRRCVIVDSEGSGIWIYGESSLEDCLISGCKDSGLRVEGAPVVARRNTIVNNGGWGIQVGSGGGGIFADNDLQRNKRGAWDISEESLQSVQRSGNLE